MTDGVSETYCISEEVYEIKVYLTRREIKWLQSLYPSYDIEAAIHQLIKDAYYSTLR